MYTGLKMSLLGVLQSLNYTQMQNSIRMTRQAYTHQRPEAVLSQGNYMVTIVSTTIAQGIHHSITTRLNSYSSEI